MAGLVGTVHVGVAGISALVALGDDVVADPFSSSVVEDEVLSEELILEVQVLYLTCVFNDPAFKLIDILEAFMLVIGTGLLTTDAPGTVHHQFLVFLVVFQVFFYDIQ